MLHQPLRLIAVMSATASVLSSRILPTCWLGHLPIRSPALHLLALISFILPL
jgi:hypothetical protein